MAQSAGLGMAGLVIAALLLVSAADGRAAASTAFEVNGFTQGMHESEAKEVAHRKGYEVHDTVSGTIISKGGKADSALFCQDGLVRYTYETHGGFMKYLDAIKGFEDQGYHRTNLDLGTQMGSDGKKFGHLGLYLFRPGDNYFVTVTLLGTEDNDTDNFTIGYEALDKSSRCGG